MSGAVTILGIDISVGMQMDYDVANHRRI
jgi:hypothetical protein